MAETLEKLRPDRDLQCYFERPSSIAALSGASPNGFTLSGTWRQQFDWAVIEWSRDNVFEHPALRNLPDGDLSGLQLTYEEVRHNCIPIDSSLYPTVDWPYLRVWTSDSFYKVPVKDHATAIEGTYTAASAVFELQGTLTTGDYIELAWQSEHHTYQLLGTDTLESAVQAIVDSVNAFSTTMTATRTGAQITLTSRTAGANGNRIGIYANVAGAKTENWQPWWRQLSGGMSPTKWRISLDFSSLHDTTGALVPMTAVRKLRWTYAAELQAGSFSRSEFDVVISNWTVTGLNRGYQVAGPGSRRIEDDAPDCQYGGVWTVSRGNFSGGSIHYTTASGATVSCSYVIPQTHRLYLGTRKAASGAQISIVVDGGPPRTENLALAGEDVLTRILLGELAGGVEHTVTVTHAGATGSYFYFDFLEAAAPVTSLPVFAADPKTTLATDWDTDHSIALAPERTAWLIHTLGFGGRANHYVGALWFYELWRKGHSYASGTIEFVGTPEMSQITEVALGFTGSPDPPQRIQHLNLVGDTAASIAKAFELEINNGYTSVWALANGALLTVTARAMGAAGNTVTIAATPSSGPFHALVSAATLTGGVDGDWRTDLQAVPRLNRAVRDWSRSFCAALKGYGITVAAAFSMELQHGDPATDAGIAQRYPSGAPVLLNTPALQTNFSPASTVFWKQVYLEMATLMVEAGAAPYLQFGEVQWWYFPYDPSGMPYYDAYTTSTFAATYGRAMHVFLNSHEDPALYPEESQFLPKLIGDFTDAIMEFVKQTYAATKFETLYPPDVNDTPLNRVVNLPSAWSPAKLECFKTENFTYTGNRNLDLAKTSITLPMQLGFPRSRSSHLVGIGEYTTPWEKESQLSMGESLESVVLFALDQFCLIGYELPLGTGMRRSLFMGA